MADFINTIDLLGDATTFASIIEGTLEEYNDDTLTTLRGSAFSSAGIIQRINLPNVIKIENNTFSSSQNLISVDLSNVSSIAQSAFMNASSFNVLILRSPTLCTLMNANAFASTPFSGGKGGTVYVPQALIESYQTATNWSTLYAGGKCNFVAIEGSEHE